MYCGFLWGNPLSRYDRQFDSARGPCASMPFPGLRYHPRMPDADDKLTPSDPREVVTALSLGLTSGRRLAKYDAAETMAKVVAEGPCRASQRLGVRGHAEAACRRNIAATVPRRLASYEAMSEVGHFFERPFCCAGCDGGHGAARGVVLDC